MTFSLIRNERLAREQREADARRAQWTGEAWRDHGRPAFKAAFTKAVTDNGVSYNDKRG